MKEGLPPDMPVFPNDWLSSTAITLMTPAEEGAYWRLLCHAWSDPTCSIPKCPVSLAALSRLGEAWATGGGAKIMACFEVDPERPDRVFNVKQRAIRDKQLKRIETAKAKASDAANARWNKKSSSSAQAMLEHSASNADAQTKHMPQNASSPVSRLPIAGERERPASEVERPGVEEVITYSQIIGLAEWKARDWFDEMQGCNWLDYQHRHVSDWRAVLRRVKAKWEADGRPAHLPTRQQANAPASNAVAEKILLEKELKRIEDRLIHIKNNARCDAYGIHFTDEERAQRKPLLARKKEILEKLGFQA